MLAFPACIQAWFALAVAGWWFCSLSETQNVSKLQGSRFQDCWTIYICTSCGFAGSWVIKPFRSNARIFRSDQCLSLLGHFFKRSWPNDRDAFSILWKSGPIDTLRKKKGCEKKTWILPWNLTWNLNMEVWKMIFLFSWVLFRFHVKFQGCRFRCHNFSTDLNRFRSWSWKIWNMFLYDPSLHGTWFFSSISRETMAKVAKLCKHTTSSA